MGNKLYIQTAPGVYTLLSNGSGEPPLGNPAVDGYVLSSTTAGVRSWVVQSGGGLTTGYHVTPSATVTVATGTTTKIPMGTVTFDVNSEDDPVNHRLVCKTNGKYLISGQCHFATGTTGYRSVYIYKNATTTGTPEVLSTGTLVGLAKISDAASTEFPIVQCFVNLVATDYIELFVRHTQGTDLVCGDVTSPVSWLSVIRIN
jgi:hypothetical protein